MGAVATLQDLGRPQAAADGVPSSGAMDVWSHSIANYLVGNEANTATLECSGGRLSAWIEKGGAIALHGAGGALYLDGQPFPNGHHIQVPEGTLLEIRPTANGNFCYLAASGGWQVPLVFESASTYLDGGFGGYKGRSLEKGDVLLAAKTAPPKAIESSRWFFQSATIAQDSPLEIRILKGAEWRNWSNAQQKLFLETPAVISKNRTRQAVRLEVFAFLKHDFGNMFSTAVVPGTIQIPPNDAPAILMADAQTTGGFPRIAQVISVDLPKIAQAKTAQLLQFRLVNIDEANRLLFERAALLRQLKIAIRLQLSQLWQSR